MARPLRGEGGKGRATKKKELYLKLEKKFRIKLWPKSSRGGGKGLVGHKNNFFAASLRIVAPYRTKCTYLHALHSINIQLGLTFVSKCIMGNEKTKRYSVPYYKIIKLLMIIEIV